MRPPSVLLLALSGITFFIGMVPFGRTFDFAITDTYYVLSHRVVFFCFAILLAVGWAVYNLRGIRTGSRVLSWIHIVFTAICIISVIYYYFKPEEPHRYYSYVDFAQRSQSTEWIPLAFFLIQLLLPINMLAGITRPRHQG